VASVTTIADARDPPAILGDTTILVKDSAGAERPAPLPYGSSRQVDYMVPAAKEQASERSHYLLQLYNGTPRIRSSNDVAGRR
jgi:hypothetical protein